MKTINFVKNTSLAQRFFNTINKPHFVLGIITAILVSFSLTAVTWSSNDFILYGVHDSSNADSQLFVLNIESGVVEALGELRPEYDIEAMGLHPTSCILYAISGGDGNGGFDGNFYSVDKSNGDLTLIGNTGAFDLNEIQAASFHPNGTLWAAQQGAGLVTVNLSDGSTNLEFADSSNDWEGLAWDLAGNFLYGADKNKLLRFDPSDQSVDLICDNLPNPTEALEYRPDGVLVGGQHNSSALNLFEVDIDTCGISSRLYEIPYTDIESIVFELCETPPPNQCVDNATPVPALSPENPTIILGDTVDFTNNSTDLEGNDLVFTWAVNQLGIIATTTNFSFTPPEVGEYIVTLKAADQCSFEVIWTTVTVIDPQECQDNATPVAVIDPLDQDVLIDETVSFTASGSTDTENNPLTYTWDVDGVEVATGIDFEFSSSVPDQYIIKLVVADECGSDEIETTVNVSESEQCLGHVDPTPVIDPQNPSITFGNTIDFGSSNSFDGDPDLMNFEWYVDGDLISSDPSFTFNPPDTGIFSIVLKAIDECGDASVETELTVTSGGGEECVGNLLPIAVAGDDLAVLVDVNLTLDATGSSDPNGDTLIYTWEIPSIGFISNDPVTSVVFSTNVPEKHIATLTVSDGCGSSTDTVEINVHSGGGGGPSCTSAGPTAVAGPDLAFNNGVEFTLDGTGSSDPENDILSYSWKIVSVGFTANTPTTSTSISNTGKYIAELTVADECSSDTDTLEIEIVSGGGPVCTENCDPEPPCTENCGGGGGGCTENCGGGGGTPDPEPEPEPVVLGEATAFSPPPDSPRAGSGLPIVQIAFGLLSGVVTSVGSYFYTRRKYALEI